jgi:hypothetical protein
MPASPRLGVVCPQSCWSGERAGPASSGRVAEAAGKLGRAEDLYRSSLAEHPGCSAALHLARVCYFRQRWEKVLLACQRARELRDAPQPPGGGDVDEVLSAFSTSSWSARPIAGAAPVSGSPEDSQSRGLEKFTRYVEDACKAGDAMTARQSRGRYGPPAVIPSAPSTGTGARAKRPLTSWAFPTRTFGETWRASLSRR